jgi:hypothetical protein
MQGIYLMIQIEQFACTPSSVDGELYRRPILTKANPCLL